MLYAGVDFALDDDFVSVPTQLSNMGSLSMSLAGVTSDNDSNYFDRWLLVADGIEYNHSSNVLAPVINLNSDVEVTGNGTSTSPWVVTK